MSWELYNGQKELDRQREQCGITVRQPDADTSWLESLKNQQPSPPPAAADDCATIGTDPLCPREVTHYPDIGLQAMCQRREICYRVYLLLRLLDVTGCGWLPLPLVYEQLCGGGDLHLFRSPRLRVLLAQGDGIFWRIQDGRLWLISPEKVALNIGLEHFTRAPTTMPVSILTGRLFRFRAEVFVSWLCGRLQSNPMTQQCIYEQTEIPPRTQRRYCKAAGVDVSKNIAIGPRWENTEQVQECAWEHKSAFEFNDSQGQQGRKGQSYVAWPLPNSYSRERRGGKGLSKKRRLNLAMKVLRNKYGILGNSLASLSRRFFHNGKQVSRAISDSNEIYFNLGKAKTGTGMWAALRS